MFACYVWFWLTVNRLVSCVGIGLRGLCLCAYLVFRFRVLFVRCDVCGLIWFLLCGLVLIVLLYWLECSVIEYFVCCDLSVLGCLMCLGLVWFVVCFWIVWLIVLFLVVYIVVCLIGLYLVVCFGCLVIVVLLSGWLLLLVGV